MPHAPINRVVVLGNIGSGKSTLSAWLAPRLDLPLVSLGLVCWRPGWEPVPNEESTEAMRCIVAGDRWLIDGISRQATRAADLIVFLDVPRRVAVARLLRRNVRWLFRSRPDMPPRCPEITMLPATLRTAWRFAATVRPDLLHHLAEARRRGAEVHHLGTDAEVEGFKREIERRLGAGVTSPR